MHEEQQRLCNKRSTTYEAHGCEFDLAAKERSRYLIVFHTAHVLGYWQRSLSTNIKTDCVSQLSATERLPPRRKHKVRTLVVRGCNRGGERVKIVTKSAINTREDRSKKRRTAGGGVGYLFLQGCPWSDLNKNCIDLHARRAYATAISLPEIATGNNYGVVCRLSATSAPKTATSLRPLGEAAPVPLAAQPCAFLTGRFRAVRQYHARVRDTAEPTFERLQHGVMQALPVPWNRWQAKSNSSGAIAVCT